MYNPQLETFIRVADAGSFSNAAEELFITPTAVIKQINTLESELGVQLFVRTHRGISLTESGKSLYKDAKYLIKYAKDSIARAKRATNDGENVLRIGTSPMTPTKFLVEIWPQIHDLYPDLKFQLVPFENTPDNARDIMANFGRDIDLVAGMFDENLLRQRKCAALELEKKPILCALSINHRLAEKDSLTMDDLFDENLMIIQRGWNRYVDSLRDAIALEYPQIAIVDFPFYDTNVFREPLLTTEDQL
jgi:DNA-binding transcriptional LysR family regulator